MKVNMTTEAGELTQLSKWWQTPSAQVAMLRAKDRRREQIEIMKRKINERKAALAKELNEWEVVA